MPPDELESAQLQKHRSLLRTPLIDIHEVADGLVLEADLPGVSSDGVSIELEENVISLRAKVSMLVPEGSRIVHQEFPIGDFVRSFILSDEIEKTEITAEIKDGVLRLTLPKASRLKTRRIEVKGG